MQRILLDFSCSFQTSFVAKTVCCLSTPLLFHFTENEGMGLLAVKHLNSLLYSRAYHSSSRTVSCAHANKRFRKMLLDPHVFRRGQNNIACFEIRPTIIPRTALLTWECSFNLQRLKDQTTILPTYSSFILPIAIKNHQMNNQLLFRFVGMPNPSIKLNRVETIGALPGCSYSPEGRHAIPSSHYYRINYIQAL